MPPFPASAPGGDALNGPPPSPQLLGGAPTGMSLAGLAGPAPVPSGGMPPEILTGIVQSAEQIGTLLDAYAQVAPDLAGEFAAVKAQLQTVLAKLIAQGAGATSPTNAGPGFPAAFDRGLPTAGPQ